MAAPARFDPAYQEPPCNAGFGPATPLFELPDGNCDDPYERTGIGPNVLPGFRLVACVVLLRANHKQPNVNLFMWIANGASIPANLGHVFQKDPSSTVECPVGLIVGSS